MSNAMRFGKRSLAAVAAGALAAGALAIAAAPSASANTGASISFAFPSITVIGSGQTAPTGIIMPVRVFDVNGTRISSGTLTNQIVELSVTEPPIFTDDSIGISLNAAADDTAISITSNNTSLLGAARIGIRPGGVPSWNQLVGAGKTGTYTITARLVNTLNGSIVQSKTMPFSLVAAAGAPAGNVSFLNQSGNVINQAGFTADDSIFHGIASPAAAGSQDDSISIYLTDPNGGPYLMDDDSVSWTTWSTSTATTSTIGGWLGAGSATALGVYQLNPGNINTTGAAGTGTITGASAPAGTTVASGTLPVQIASIKTGANPTVALTNSDAYGVPTYDDSYQVPAGTKELTFSIATTGGFDDSSIAYNATVTNTVTGTAAGQVLTSFGGRTAIKSDQGTLTIALNDAAQVAGTQVFVEIGRWNAASNARTLVEVDIVNPAATVFSTPGLAKVSSEATIPGTVTTQFGAALPGTWTARLKSGTVAAANCAANTTIGTPVVASATGAFTLTAPAAFAATTNGGTSTFTICADNGFGSFAALPVTVTYTTTGGVTSMTLSTAGITGVTQTSAARPLVKVPPSGTASLTQVAASSSIPGTSLTEAQVIAAGQAFTLTATVTPNTTVTFTGTDGVRFTDRTAGSVFWSDAVTSLDVLSAANSAPASVIATKPGIHTVTVTAGTTTQTYTFRAEVSTQGARTIAAEPTSLNMATNEFKELNVTVQDIYGNAVPRVSSTSTGATLANTLAGGGTVSSLVTGGSIAATDAAGKTSVTYTAPAGVGDARVGWVLAGGQVDVPIAGAPATVKSQSVNIKVGSTPSTKTIVIVGERATVSGKPGIRVEGETTGFADGAAMKPWVRFPGQTEYAAGSARPTVSAIGDFSWQRKTGKKTYVYFSSADDAIKSNRVIIPAN